MIDNIKHLFEQDGVFDRILFQVEIFIRARETSCKSGSKIFILNKNSNGLQNQVALHNF